MMFDDAILTVTAPSLQSTLSRLPAPTATARRSHSSHTPRSVRAVPPLGAPSTSSTSASLTRSAYIPRRVSAAGRSLSQSQHSPNAAVNAADVGRRVCVNGEKYGTLRFVGPVMGKSGVFAGVALDAPEGMHDGETGGVRYFVTSPNHGVFVPVDKVHVQRLVRNDTFSAQLNNDDAVGKLRFLRQVCSSPRRPSRWASCV